MKLLISTLFCFILTLLLAYNTYANFAMFQLGMGVAVPDVVCDITTGIATGVGSGTCVASPAACDGVADDAPAFTLFNTWATATWQASHTGLIGLRIPANKTCTITGLTVKCGVQNANKACPFIGIRKLLVFGVDSTSVLVPTNLISLSGMGLAQGNTHSARTSTVSAGSSCVTLISTPTAAVSAMADNGSGNWRVTLNSTTGFVDGKSYYFSGILGATKSNGLQMVQVIDGTHVDLLTVSSVGQTYTSGGTVGGDRTALFTVGNYALMAGYDLQGLWLAPFGFPPNNHYFEYVKVASLDAGTHQICFDAPLVNTYKSTWPLYNSGNNDSTGNGEVDAGGPATLYYLDPSWDTELEVRNLTLDRSGSQTYAKGRVAVYRNVVVTGVDCIVPTEAVSWSVINSSMTSCSIEVDKNIGSIIVSGTTMTDLKFQSSSTDLLQIRGSTLTGALTGSPKQTDIRNSTIASFRPGAYAYGRSNETVCINCVLASISPLGVTEKGPSDIGVNIAYTMSGGIITVPNVDNAVRWAVPGTNLMWQGAQESETAFRVVDVTQDFTNTYVQTTLAAGFPSVPLTGGKLYIRVHPAPKFTCTNCTGSADAIDLSQAIPTAPIYSYSNRTYTQATLTGNATAYDVWGAITSYGVNVTTAYAGATTPLTLRSTSQVNFYPVLKSDYSQTVYSPNINMRAAGNRVITGVTCPGAGCTGNQTGDTSLGFPEANAWFTGPVRPFITTDVSASGTFSVTITVQTDQGVVNP